MPPTAQSQQEPVAGPRRRKTRDRYPPSRLDRPYPRVRRHIRSRFASRYLQPASVPSRTGHGRRAPGRWRGCRARRCRPDGRGDRSDHSGTEATRRRARGLDRHPRRRHRIAECARGRRPRRAPPQPGNPREPLRSDPRRGRWRGGALARSARPLARPGGPPPAPGLEPTRAELRRADGPGNQGPQAPRGRPRHSRSWTPPVLFGAHRKEHRPRCHQPAEPTQSHPGGRLRVEAGLDLRLRQGVGGVVPTTSVEHETEDRAPAHGAEAQRRDGPVPAAERDGAAPLATLSSAPPGLFHTRMLLGLQATAGNAAVANLLETRKPEPAPAPLTAEASPEEATVAEPRAGESDDELAALDAEAGQETSISPPSPGERGVGDAESGDSPEAEGGGTDPGTPIEERPAPAVPDVSAAEPATGLARVGSLPPAQLLSSLGTVSTAVNRQTAEEHGRLAANVPQRPRHPGAPSTVESPASTRLALADGPAPVSLPAMPEGRDLEVHLKPGTLPHLPLEGNADPALIQQQRSRVLGGLERQKVSGQQEAGRPLGEDEIFPTAPAETLRASIGEMPGGAGHAAAQPKPAEDDEAASMVAQQAKGTEIQSAVGTGLASLAGQREEYAQRTAAERARADAEMSQLEQANTQEQAGERAAAKREVAGLRGQWTTGQQELVAGAHREAEGKTSETLKTVAKERGAAEEQATAHYDQGQQEAQKAKHDAEQQAAAERQKAQSQSPGGLLGAIGSAAQSLFDKAKQAVQSVFDRARQLVRSAIEKAQQLATAVMERARQTIVGAIRAAGSALMAIGDRVLVALPALRTRFRKAIQDRIAAAEAVVNKLANGLKQAVQTALNLLGTALSAAIGLLQKGMQAAVDGVRGVVQGALAFAKGALAAFGTFAVLVKDIAANPGRWVTNLAAAARDGIRNHLWPDLKAAVQGWFKDKVDGVLGLGSAVWNLLRRGGITVAHVATFAWEGIKSMIPQTVIWVLIEKLVALIVPAAAAVMLIIQALQAAWGSLGRILQAVDAFVGFLKGIRWGNAGPLFGTAIAAGAVAVVEFISQFLLQRLMGAAGKVAGKLRSLAKRIGARLGSVGRGTVRGARLIGRGIRAA